MPRCHTLRCLILASSNADFAGISAFVFPNKYKTSLHSWAQPKILRKDVRHRPVGQIGTPPLDDFPLPGPNGPKVQVDFAAICIVVSACAAKHSLSCRKGRRDWLATRRVPQEWNAAARGCGFLVQAPYRIFRFQQKSRVLWIVQVLRVPFWVLTGGGVHNPRCQSINYLCKIECMIEQSVDPHKHSPKGTLERDFNSGINSRSQLLSFVLWKFVHFLGLLQGQQHGDSPKWLHLDSFLTFPFLIRNQFRVVWLV